MADASRFSFGDVVLVPFPFTDHTGTKRQRSCLSLPLIVLEGCVAEAGITADPLTHGGRSVAVVDAVATVSATGGAWAIALVNRPPADAVDCRASLTVAAQ
jgi:hypothetical protein